MTRVVHAHRLRHRRRRRRDPRGAPARLARRAPGVRSMTMRACAHARGTCAPRASCAGCRRVALARAASPAAARGKGLIPVANAGPLQSDFEAVAPGGRKRRRQLHGDRSRAARRPTEDFSALPASVDRGLRSTLRQGIANLRSRALAPVRAAARAGHRRRARRRRRRRTTTTTTTPTVTHDDRRRTTTHHARDAPPTPPSRGGGTRRRRRSRAERRTGRAPSSAKAARRRRRSRRRRGAGGGQEGGK